MGQIGDKVVIECIEIRCLIFIRSAHSTPDGYYAPTAHCSDAVLDPQVPQALRLQAILTTGIVKVHEKKVSCVRMLSLGWLPLPPYSLVARLRW